MQEVFVALFVAFTTPILEMILKKIFGESRDKNQISKEALSLANFIESISDLLLVMYTKLSDNKVPTYEGYQLEWKLKSYTDVVAKLRITDNERKELESQLPDLQALLRNAELVDGIIRGDVLNYDPALRDKLLLDLLRTADRMKGMSDVLKVIYAARIS